MIRTTALCLGLLILNSAAVAQDISPDWDAIGEKAKKHKEYVDSLLMQGVLKMSDLRASKVGKLGRAEALEFEGVKTFPEGQIRKALAKDFDVLLASDSQANLPTYLKTLQRRLSEGYRKNGFPKVKVTAEADENAGKIQIRIEEGRQYRRGQVQVEGPEDIDSDVMVRYLTDSEIYKAPLTKQAEKDEHGRPKKSSKAKLWKADEVVDFFEDPTSTYREAIEAGFAAQGYFFPEFETEILPANEDTADLWIRVKDPGPQATIGQITIKGTWHHTPGQIRDFLGIKSGLHVDYEQKLRWERKLRDSHCFLESEVIVLPAIAPGAPSELLIRLVEQPKGPYLGEELTEQDKLFAKTATWMTDWKQGGQGDFIILGRVDQIQPWSCRFLLIASSHQGYIVDVELASPKRQKPLHYTAAVMRDEVRLISWHAERELRLLNTTGTARANFRFRYEKSEEEPGEWSMHLAPSLGYTSQRNDEEKSFTCEFVMPRAVAIALGRRPDSRIEHENGILTLTRKGLQTTIEADTGRILSVVPEEAAPDLARLRSESVPQVRRETAVLYFQPGTFERFLQKMDQDTQGFQAAYQPKRPLSSVLEFFLGEAEEIGEPDRPIPIFKRLVELDALGPLDRVWIDWQAKTKGTDKFNLPWSSEDEKLQLFGLEKKLPFGLGKQLARVAFGVHGLVVPPDSGPALVGWNLALLCTGRFGEMSGNLQQMPQTPAVGPLTCWYASGVFGWLNQNWKRQFADAGLQKLDDETFRRELDHLLPEESLLFELVGSFGNAVRQLDDDEFAQLALLLGDQAQHPAVPRMIEKIRQEQGRPSRDLLLDSLVTLWDIRGRAYCREQLEKLADTQAAPPEVNPDDFTLDALFPEGKSKSKDKQSDEKVPRKNRFKILGGTR